MKTIIVGFSKSTKKFKPFSTGIMLWDDCPYSHVYFKFKNEKYNINLIYQASSNMLNYMAEPIFLLNNEVVQEFEIQVSNEQYFSLIYNCMSSAGLLYGKKQIVGIVIADILNLKRNIFANSTQYHCSEWVAEQLQELGFKFDIDLDLIKPKHIYKVLHEINSKR